VIVWLGPGLACPKILDFGLAQAGSSQFTSRTPTDGSGSRDSFYSVLRDVVEIGDIAHVLAAVLEPEIAGGTKRRPMMGDNCYTSVPNINSARR
jgi:hypothetical protein